MSFERWKRNNFGFWGKWEFPKRRSIGRIFWSIFEKFGPKSRFGDWAVLKPQSIGPDFWRLEFLRPVFMGVWGQFFIPFLTLKRHNFGTRFYGSERPIFLGHPFLWGFWALQFLTPPFFQKWDFGRFFRKNGPLRPRLLHTCIGSRLSHSRLEPKSGFWGPKSDLG